MLCAWSLNLLFKYTSYTCPTMYSVKNSTGGFAWKAWRQSSLERNRSKVKIQPEYGCVTLIQEVVLVVVVINRSLQGVKKICLINNERHNCVEISENWEVNLKSVWVCAQMRLPSLVWHWSCNIIGTKGHLFPYTFCSALFFHALSFPPWFGAG